MALKENMTRMTVNLDKEKYNKLKELAAKEGRSASNYVNWLVDKEIKKLNKQHQFNIILTIAHNISKLICYLFFHKIHSLFKSFSDC